MKRITISMGVLWLISMPIMTFAVQTDAPLFAWGNVWARPALAEGTTAIYGDLHNLGEAPLSIVALESSDAESVELHQSVMEDDMMRMNEIDLPLEIDADDVFMMEPGDFHIMLVGLVRDLEEGDAVTVTLTVEQNGETYPVVMSAPVSLEAPEPSALVVRGAWARPTPNEDGEAMSAVSAAYLQITNTSDEDLTIISAATNFSMTELHESRMENDVMTMRELEDGISIAAGETVELRPGGMHIMLMNLETPLLRDHAQTVELTLDDETTFVLGIPVYDPFLIDEMDMDMEDDE